MARTMGSLEVVIESTPQDGEPGWSVYVVRSHRRFAAGGLAVAHETLKDAEWFADQVFEIITGKREPIEHGGVTDLIASGAAAQASYGAIAAVAAALGVDAKAFSLAIAPWMENKKNPPPPIGIAGLANAIEDSERHLAALSATVPPPLPPV